MSSQFSSLYSEQDALTALTGQSNRLLDQFPYYSLTEVGLPAGPNFLAEAKAMQLPPDPVKLSLLDTYREIIKPGSKPMTAAKRRKAEQAAQYAAVTRAADVIYWRALYDPLFNLVIDLKGRTHIANFLLGHLWDDSVTGPVPADVMVVGKHPGVQELNEGANFSGTSSANFRRLIESLGFHGAGKWYMTNMMRFVNPSLLGRGGSGTVSAEWISDCAPLLANEIRLVRPKFILCLGAEAIKAVLGRDYNLKNTAGRVLDLPIVYPDGEEHIIKVATCLHPAAVEYRPEWQDDLEAGVKRFLALIDGSLEAAGPDPEADREHIVIHSIDELRALFERLDDEQRTEFAIDCEWHKQYPTEPGAYLRSIQFSWECKKAACIALTEPGGARHFQGTDAEIVELLTAAWDKPNVRIIGHYFSADLPWLQHYGLGFLLERFWTPAKTKDGLLAFERTKTEGGFDTILVAHAHSETAAFKLEDLVLKHTTMGRYDSALLAWRKKYCKEHKIPDEQLDGYGDCPSEILWWYGMCDADGAFRLYRLYNDKLLDCDMFGNCARESFWRSMRAAPAFLEAHMTGVRIDTKRAESIRQDFEATRDDICAKIRKELEWPTFNPNSVPQCKEALFGEEYNGKAPLGSDQPIRIRPEGARSCYLQPYKSTGKRSQLWVDIVRKGLLNDSQPATDKETLSVLGTESSIASQLRDFRFIAQVGKSLLQAPETTKTGELIYDGFGDFVYEKGIMAAVMADGRVRTHFSQTKETRRASSWGPPLQNISKRREPDYQRIMGVKHKHKLRSIFQAADGHVLLSADLVTAEVAAAAWMAFDRNLMDHARRASLPESDPNHYDIHSQVAVKTFRLDCAPIKSALEKAKLEHFRTAAKTRLFGWFYGQGVLAAWRKIREEGINISMEEVEALSQTLYDSYPELVRFFSLAGERVVEVGWLCNAYGSYRRFYPTDDEKVLEDQKREGINFFIQGGVADNISQSMANFKDLKRAERLRSNVVLQIHDDLTFECPIEEAAYMYGTVIPECMVRRSPFVPCLLDGTPRDDGPYYFGVDRAFQLRWSEKLPEDFAKQHMLTKADLAVIDTL